MIQLLKQLNACKEAQEWAAGKTWSEVYSTCERGDWLLWLFKKTNPDDLQLITLAKGHSANTVRHLMKDQKSLDAVDITIKFGEGKATLEELDDAAGAAAYAADAANTAAYAADAANTAGAAADAAYAAYAAAGAAGVVPHAAAYAANAAGAANAADSAYAAAVKKENQQLTAEICRKYLPIEVWNINSLNKQD